jgi:hypothetical protein
MEHLALVVAVGFFAQLVDGALGMAYGTITSLTLLTLGLPPAAASATVHSASIFTCTASGAAHCYHKNVDWRLVARLAPPGVLGAVIGATVLSNVDGNMVRPFVALYLGALGIVIFARVWQRTEPRETAADGAVVPTAAVGGLLDSLGGGWGPIVTSTLLGRGHIPRTVIGSVNLSQTAVALAAAATFTAWIGASNLPTVLGLVIGGIAAAPFGSWAVRAASPRLLIALVGCLVLTLSGWALWRSMPTG